jgi:hypothetical protein
MSGDSYKFNYPLPELPDLTFASLLSQKLILLQLETLVWQAEMDSKIFLKDKHDTHTLALGLTVAHRVV